MRLILLALFALNVSGCGPFNEPSEESEVQTASSDVSSSSAMSEAKFRAGMAVEEIETISYEDESGNAIPFETFIATVTSGRSFSKKVSQENSTATMSIDPIGSDKDHSTQAPKHRLKVPLSGLMPELDSADLDGNSHRLNNGANYTLLSFFFSECVPCIQEVPEMNALARSRVGLDVLAITFDSDADARKFVAKYGFEVPVIAASQDYIDAVGVSVYPTLVLVSPDGRLVAAKISREASANSDAIAEWLDGLGV